MSLGGVQFAPTEARGSGLPLPTEVLPAQTHARFPCCGLSSEATTSAVGRIWVSFPCSISHHSHGSSHSFTQKLFKHILCILCLLVFSCLLSLSPIFCLPLLTLWVSLSLCPTVCHCVPHVILSTADSTVCRNLNSVHVLTSYVEDLKQPQITQNSMTQALSQITCTGISHRGQNCARSQMVDVREGHSPPQSVFTIHFSSFRSCESCGQSADRMKKI